MTNPLKFFARFVLMLLVCRAAAVGMIENDLRGQDAVVKVAAAAEKSDTSAAHQNTNEVSAAEALARLKEGNKRFAENHPSHNHESADWRVELLKGQHPFAVIVGCADSRVPPELIFDQGFGDLFVIRNAGNLIATDVLASIEYAVLHLNTQLVVILGHDDCGAVTAALASREEREQEQMELQTVLKMIDVALSDSPSSATEKKTLATAIRANVRWAIKQLRFLAAERNDPRLGKTQFVGAVYDMNTGKVNFLDL